MKEQHRGSGDSVSTDDDVFCHLNAGDVHQDYWYGGGGGGGWGGRGMPVIPMVTESISERASETIFIS